MKKITGQEVARQAGVSVSAVSIVLNNRKGVSDETRKKVQRILLENGILPRNNGISSSKGTVLFCKIAKHGGIINDRHNVFLSDYIDGVEEEGRKEGFSLEFTSFNRIPIMDVVSSIRENTPNIVGCVILSTELDETDIALFQNNITKPCVFLDTCFPEMNADFITMDNYGMVQQAIQYLVSCGHKRIGMIASDRCGNFSARVVAFRTIMNKLGRTPIESDIKMVRSTLTEAYEDCLMLFQKDDGMVLPTAFFACNDIMAIALIRALEHLGLHVPQDVSVIGFDNLPVSAVTTPGLSSMDVPKFSIGQTAITLLTRRLEENTHGLSSQKVFLGGDIIERESVRKVE